MKSAGAVMTPNELEALRLVRGSSVWFPTCGRDEQRDTFASLCDRGHVAKHLSSIGETSEKIHFSITDLGRKTLAHETAAERGAA